VAQFTRLVQNKRVYRKLSHLSVKRQLEAIRKQRLHHQAHLIFGRITFRTSLNVEAICLRPLGQLLG
jgi:hypothetical protein